MSKWSDELLSGLSADTMKALKEFAVNKGIKIDDEEASDGKVLDSVHDHFRPPGESETIFNIDYKTSSGVKPEKRIAFNVKGLKKECGQTLNSTGLTIWRAAEHLCQYIIDHESRFASKRICELGAGLGLVSILLDKLNVADAIYATDGDEPTMELLINNQIDCECLFNTQFLLWGEHEDFLSENPDKFDTLIAADVIYEEEQIVPLLNTVVALMRPQGEFILAFARRNVSIDKVFAAAKERHLTWTVLDDEYQGISMEPIYSFTFNNNNK